VLHTAQDQQLGTPRRQVGGQGRIRLGALQLRFAVGPAEQVVELLLALAGEGGVDLGLRDLADLDQNLALSALALARAAQ
jgi:hypothetical protein